MKIGIAGFGFVGQAVYGSIKDKQNVIISDPFKNYHNDITQSDMLFVCVGTPENDFSSVISLLDALDIINYPGVVIVKSTIPYNYLIDYNLKIVANPEFLNQISAQEDFRKQLYVVLGGERDLTAQVENMYKRYFDLTFPKYEHCTIEEAMNFKYVRNIYGAFKVLYWNYVEEMYGNSRKMAEMLKNIPQGEMSLVGLDGKLGYGGACFPKDVNTSHTERPHELTRFMKKYNSRLHDN